MQFYRLAHAINLSIKFITIHNGHPTFRSIWFWYGSGRTFLYAKTRTIQKSRHFYYLSFIKHFSADLRVTVFLLQFFVDIFPLGSGSVKNFRILRIRILCTDCFIRSTFITDGNNNNNNYKIWKGTRHGTTRPPSGFRASTCHCHCIHGF